MNHWFSQFAHVFFVVVVGQKFAPGGGQYIVEYLKVLEPDVYRALNFPATGWVQGEVD